VACKSPALQLVKEQKLKQLHGVSKDWTAKAKSASEKVGSATSLLSQLFHLRALPKLFF
jgi:hypothetical protein